MKRSVKKLTPEAKERLGLIEYLEQGHSVADAAKRWGIAVTTAYRWRQMYEKEGIEGLSVPRKSHTKYNIDLEQVTADLKVAPKKYRERLALIEYIAKGSTVAKAAKRWKVDITTAYRWLELYQEAGIEGLSIPRKPRKDYDLDEQEIQAALKGAPEKYHDRLKRLLELAEGKPLKQVGEDWTISVQSIMKDRRLFVAGKLPPIINL